jgi:hypothetical protein
MGKVRLADARGEDVTDVRPHEVGVAELNDGEAQPGLNLSNKVSEERLQIVNIRRRGQRYG